MTPNSSRPTSASKKKRKSSEPYLIPWEDKNAFKLSSNYFKTQLPNYQLTLDEDSVYTYSTTMIGDTLTFKVGRIKDEIIVSITFSEDYLQLHCSCNKKVQTICNHAYLVIIKKAEKDPQYFKKFHFPEVLALDEKQRTLFNIDPKNDYHYKPKFIVHEKHGRVFNFSAQDETYDDPINLFMPLIVLPQSRQKLIFGIPLHQQHFAIPILLPYLTRTGTKASERNPYASFDKSYLFEKNGTPLSLSIEEEQVQAVCIKMLYILNMPEESILALANEVVREDEKKNTILKIKKTLIVNLWKEIIPKLHQHTVFFFYTYHTGISFVKPSARTIYAWSPSIKDVQVTFELTDNQDYFQLKLVLYIDGAEVAKPDIITSRTSFLIRTEKNEVVFVNSARDEETIEQFRECNFCLTILPEDIEGFKTNILNPLLEHYEISYHAHGQSARFIEMEPMQVLQQRVSFLIQDDLLLLIPATIYYKSIVADPLKKGNSLLLSTDGIEEIHYRNVFAEEHFRKLLLSLHPEFTEATEVQQLRIPLLQVKEGTWFAQTVITLQENKIKVIGIDELQGLPINPHPVLCKIAIKGDNNWFNIGLDLKLDKHKLTLEQLDKVIRKGEEIIELPDGSVGSIPLSLQQQMKSLFRIGEISKKELRISALHFNSMQSFSEHITDPALLNRVQSQRKKLQALDSIQTLDKPERVNADLRPYQLAGFSWLAFLREFGWGGILADDMGLGKTLQVLTILEHHYQLKPHAAPSLIVLPNTLLFNWQQEILKFTPHREFMIHQGTARPKTLEIGTGKILLTTYGTVIADIDLFSKINFSYLILDESQAIKNPKSKRFKAIQMIIATYRLALTGTPIENGISDLFAQLDFVNPGFLGSFTQFKRSFSGIAAGTATNETVDHLLRIIDPFLLRRTKLQVAKDLPEKTEMVLYCEMLPEQRLIYEKYRQGFREKLEDKVDEGLDKAKFFVLEGLMKLRQICNSPAIIKNENYPNYSIKLNEIQEHILEKTQGHKLLIFSSFTSMLGLLREQLEGSDISYAYLDGKTPQELRQSEVNRFQEDKSCKVFLISLKAGGTGLNLTAADYVYILDPWWNPAAEAQAIDRCYRIGQEKHVMAYRMICKDSIEEKILDLQKGKKELADTLIQTDQSVLKSLKKEDLLSLFD